MNVSLRNKQRPKVAILTKTLKCPPYALVRGIHLLSLDAPLVATLWLHEFSRILDLTQPTATYLSLFGAVWFIYLVDRFLDSNNKQKGKILGLRHATLGRSPSYSLLGIASLGCANLYLVTQLPTSVFILGLKVAFLVLIYLLCYHLLPLRPWVTRFKEEWMAAIFVIGVLVPVLGRSATVDRPFLILIGLFYATCLLNCRTLTFWENRSDPAFQTAPQPGSQKPAIDRLYWAYGWVAGICLLAMFLLPDAYAHAAIALSLACGGFACLHYLQPHWGLESTRALIDPVLIAGLAIVHIWEAML